MRTTQGLGLMSTLWYCGWATVATKVEGGRAGTVARFQPSGQLIAPARYEEVTMDYPWEAYFDEVDALLDQDDKLWQAWMASVNASKDTDAEKQERISKVKEVRGLRKTKTVVLLNQAKALVFFKKSPKNTIEDTQKRGFMDWVGHLIALTFGISNKRSIDDLEIRQDQVHHDTVVNRKLETETRKAIAVSFRRYEEALEDSVYLEAVSFTHMELQTDLQEMVSSVYLGMQGVVGSHFFKPLDMTDLEDKVKNFTMERQLKVVGSSALVTMPKSVLITSTMARIIFHIPLVREDQGLMNLYRMGTVEIDFNGTVFKVNSEREYLAESALGMMSLTVTDIQLCDRREGILVCKEPRLLEKVPLTCISAIYRSDRARVNKLCSLEAIDKDKLHIIQDSEDEFSCRTQKSVRINCGAAQKTTDWAKLETRTVLLRCSAENEEFKVIPAPPFDPLPTVDATVELDNATAVAFKLTRDLQRRAYNATAETWDKLVEVPTVEDLTKMRTNLWIYVVGAVVGTIVVVVGLGLGLLKLVRKGLSEVMTPKEVQCHGPSSGAESLELRTMERLGPELAIAPEVAPLWAGLEALRTLNVQRSQEVEHIPAEG